MDGNGEQPGPAPGGSVGRSGNLQGGVQRVLQGGTGDMGFLGAHWPLTAAVTWMKDTAPMPPLPHRWEKNLAEDQGAQR